MAGPLARLFGGRPKRDPEAVARLKAWALASGLVAADTAFSVSEIVCADPGCPGIETVILVMEPGRRTRACKIAKTLDAVTEQDVRDALV